MASPISIRAKVPSPLRAGESAKIELRLECAKDIKIKSLSAELIGIDQWMRLGDLPLEREFLRLRADVLGATALPAGESTHRVRFGLPPSCPRSYRGAAGTTRYLLLLTLRRGLGRTIRREMEVELSSTVEPVEPRPIRAMIAVDRESPECEVSLASDAVQPGQVLHGALAPRRTARFAYEKATVTLRALESRHSLGGGSVERTSVSTEVDLRRAREGESLAFSLPVHESSPVAFPPTKRPDGADAPYSFGWVVQLAVHVEERSPLVLELPVRVLEEAPEPVFDAPGVGADRLANLWRKAGRLLGFSEQDGALVAKRHGATVRLERHSGDTDLLIGRMSFPTLLLELSWSRDDGGWESAKGRDPAQVASALGRLFGPHPPQDLESIDDRSAVWRRELTQLRRPETVEELGRQLVEMARTLKDKRDDIPPPTGMEDCLDKWRDLASRIQGQLHVGLLRAQGTLQGHDVEISLRFAAGIAVGTALTVAPRRSISADRVGEHSLQVDTPSMLQQQLMRVTPKARHAQIWPESIEVHLPGALFTASSPISASEALVALGRLVDLADLLASDGGPYR